MKIEYASARKEIWNLYCRQFLFGNLKWLHLRISAMIFISVFAINSTSNTLPFQSIINASIYSLAVILFMFVYPQLMFKSKQRSLTIGTDGIKTEIGKYSSLITWKEINKIENIDDNIYVTGSSGNAFVLPNRAFDNDTHRMEFFNLANSYFNESSIGQ